MEKINDSRDLRQRAWYFTRIYADPKNEDVVYVLNVSFHKSSDAVQVLKRFQIIMVIITIYG